MEREYPTYDIEGTTFLVDVFNKRLLEKDGDARIYFNRMEDKGTHYEFDYDKSEKALVEDIWIGDVLDIINVRVPQMAALHPEGMCEKYGLTMEQIKGRSDFEIMKDHGPVAKNFALGYPRIAVADEPYYTDLRKTSLNLHGEPAQPSDKEITAGALSVNQIAPGKSEKLISPNKTIEIEPVKVRLKDDVFLLDIDNKVLHQKNDPSNTIAFEQMWNHGRFYSLNYDTVMMNLANEFSDKRNVVYLEIPQMADLAPGVMAKKYGYRLDQIGKMTDLEIMIDKAQLNKRLSYTDLPILKIDLVEYTVYLPGGLLISKDKNYPGIHLSELSLLGSAESQHKNEYTAFFDFKTKQPVKLDLKELTSLPQNVFLIKIPGPEILDPVGYARLSKFEDLFYVDKFGFKKEHRAKLIPLEQTSLPKIIEQNKLRKLSRPNNPRKRGIGL